MGAGGLIWLMATACGETSGDSDPETPSDSDSAANTTGSMGTATNGSAMGAGTPSASNASNGTTTGTGGGASGDAVTVTGTGGGTGNTTCPTFEPAPGASCTDEGTSCEFTNCVAPDFRNDHTLTCVDGAWVLADEVECLPGCPETTPVIGDSCDETATPGPCPVTNACGTAYAYCSAGEWSLQASGRVPMPDPNPDGAGGSSSIIALICPNPAPALGSACCPSRYPTFCDYESGQGVPGAGGSGSGFAPPPGTTGSQGGAETTSTTDASGATSSGDGAGASGSTGGTGATGATGAYVPLCMACDPTSMQWIEAEGCN